jgi:hypothetical protein
MNVIPEAYFKIGDAVMIDSCDGFGGPAKIIEQRNIPGARFRVAMDDNNPGPFWAHDFEVSPIGGWPPESESVKATREHIRTVQTILGRVIDDLYERRGRHDLSKLESPEAEVFEEFTPKLAATTYGSDEYKSYLAAMKPALDHHYAANSHHPEHFVDGIRGMSLLDLVEMICDWAAACKRHADGSITRSIEINQARFGYSDELKQIFLNTLPAIRESG